MEHVKPAQREKNKIHLITNNAPQSNVQMVRALVTMEYVGNAKVVKVLIPILVNAKLVSI